MAKNPNGKPMKRDNNLFGAMIFFLTGCIAEFFLLLVRRYLVNGLVEEALAWYGYLKVTAGVGVVLLIAGVALSVLWKKDGKKRFFGWALGALGGFLAVSSILIRMYENGAVTLFSLVVPAAMVLCVIWAFYERECSVALTVLGTSFVVLWICRRLVSSLTLGIPVRICAVIYLLLAAGLAWLAKKEKLGFLLPARADPLPIYIASGLSVLAVLVALFSATAAYYAMWCLGVVIFALAVYYTVRQL